MISSEVREQVRARVDLAELIAHYIPLRRAGTSLIARCPFHDEKTASFHVSRDKGLFHCFGCKASGDVFDFYQRIEGVSFPEAIKALAEKAGVEVTEEARDPQKIAEERRAKELSERLFSACELACQFFEQSLLDAERSELAREAIEARGVTMETAKAFRLGYAPGEWSALAEFFRAHSVSPADAEIAGLLLARNTGGMYDRFRHRLMFPVFDRQGRVVAFSGRVLPVTEDMAEGIVPENAGKYINSPETPVYKKSDLLYGLQVARHAMVKSADAILVEGNFDVVTMHQHGFTNTVCPLGTAFTDQQARLLRRFAETVTILFDADDAGRKAVRQSYAACQRVKLDARVASVPRSIAKDPDELLRTEGGPTTLTNAISDARSLTEWMIYDLGANAADTVTARAEALDEAVKLIAHISSETERHLLIENVAMIFTVYDRGYIQHALRQQRTKDKVEIERQRAGTFRARETAFANIDEPFRRPEVVVDALGEVDVRTRSDGESKAIGYAITALLEQPTLLLSPVVDELLPYLPSLFAQPLVMLARAQLQSIGKFDGPKLIDLATNERARSWLCERLVAVPADDAAAVNRALEVVTECVKRLKSVSNLDASRRLRQQASRSYAEGDTKKAAELIQQAHNILKQPNPHQGAPNNTKRSVG
jgi:DNA primase